MYSIGEVARARRRCSATVPKDGRPLKVARCMRVAIGMLLLTLLVLPVPTAVNAATYTIANGDVAGLIAAIAAANASGGATAINLAAGGVYTVTTANNASATGANGFPIITGNAQITINGNGATIQRSTAAGTPNFRFFTINSGATLQVNNLALLRAFVTGAASGSDGTGGAILNNGTLVVTNGDLEANGAFGTNGAAGTGSANGSPGGNANGGAIANAGTATITGSTFATNSTTGATGGAGNAGGKGGDASGGAIANSGTLTIINSTFTRNTAIGGVGGDSNGTVPGANGGNAHGGAIAFNTGSAIVTNVTITGNQTRAGDEGIGSPDGKKGTGTGGAIGLLAGSLTVTTTIIDSNQAGNSQASPYNNCSGTVAGNDGGHNLEYIPPVNPVIPPTCGFSASSPTLDVFTDPKLGSIGDNGGPTPTIALLAGSGAINTGGATCPSGIAADQRGQPRPQGSACDIGAFEYVATGNPTLNPASGPTTGGPVLFTGGLLQMGTVVTVNGANAPVDSVSADGRSLTAIVPPHAAGTVSAFAANPGHLVGPSTTFTYINAMTVISIGPTSGLTAGGSTVTLTGSGFGAPLTVTLGGNPCTQVVVVNSGLLTCTTPAGTGVVDVAVTKAGQTVLLPQAYTYGVIYPLPSVKPSASPPAGTPGPLPASRLATDQSSSSPPPPSPLPPRR